MRHPSISHDPYEENNRQEKILELLLAIQRALTLKALYEKMIDVLTFTYKRFAPNLVPGIMYYVLTRRVLGIHPAEMLSNLLKRQALTPRWYILSIPVTIIVFTVLLLLEMAVVFIAVLGQQYVFWYLFIRKPKNDRRNPPRQKPPRRQRDIRFP